MSKVGVLCGDDARRDAIHVAIAPVVAWRVMSPGEHIGLSAEDSAHVGIVDPFLLGSVCRGETFYVFLYPDTVTSLRHEWTHPVFDVIDSQRWLRTYCDHENVSYDELLRACESVNSKEFIGYDLDKCLMDIPDEMWDHYERATGRKATVRTDILTCRC